MKETLKVQSDAHEALTEETLLDGLSFLSNRDRDLARVLEKFGPPPLWAREPGFHTLLQIILEQQVSLASARAAYERLLNVCSPLRPDRFLEMDDATLKLAGFSRQKMAYTRDLARTIVEGRLSLTALEGMNDMDARSRLVKIKGIGPWTADIYLLMALGRPDVWPAGDLALAVAAQKIKRLPSRPTPDELHDLSRGWRPWRAVAARVLWHSYLNDRASVSP